MVPKCDDLCLYIITQQLSSVQGGGILVSRFIKILSPMAKNIFLITSNFDDCLKDINNVYIKNIKTDDKKESMHIRILKYGLYQLRIALAMVKMRKESDISIFYLGGMALLLPMLSSKLLGKKAILIITGSGSKSAEKIYSKRLWGAGGSVFSIVLNILEQTNYLLCDYIVIYSKCLIGEYKLSSFKNKIFVAPMHFVDLDKYRITTCLNERPLIIGYVGRLSEEKGVLNFAHSIPKTLNQNKNLKFLLIGEGNIKQKIELYIEENNLVDNVELLGWVSHEDLPAYLNKFRLLVLPSYTEGLPNIMLESMACGVPVLASPVGAIPDVIRDHETGFLMENNSPECIAANVIRVFEDPDLEGVAKRARTMVESEFTFDNAMERWRKILVEICNDL